MNNSLSTTEGLNFYQGDANALTENQKSIYQSIKNKIASLLSTDDEELNTVLEKANKEFTEYVKSDWA